VRWLMPDQRLWANLVGYDDIHGAQENFQRRITVPYPYSERPGWHAEFDSEHIQASDYLCGPCQRPRINLVLHTAPPRSSNTDVMVRRG
jgi:hypothetical protein